jgi:methionyl-tRNA formyltransferase
MTPRLDDGDVLLRQDVEIATDWNHEQLERRLGRLGGELAISALDSIELGTAELTPQDHGRATYCSTHTRADTIIDWNRSAEELHNFIRAWAPDIGAVTSLNGRVVKIFRAACTPPPEPGGAEGVAPGTVTALARKAFWVAAGSGALRIDELQPENRPRMDTGSFMAGNRVEPGMQLGD